MGDNASVVGLAMAIVFAATLIVGHFILFPVLHRGANLNEHLAIRLADTLVCPLAWVAAGCLVPMTTGKLFFWQAGTPVASWLVLGLCLAWLACVWLVPPGPSPRPAAN
ncbi:MAG: hypothetical protein HYU66_15405 [Armatimonadetes bacterium]|nr:hypothetical protein [Armatimonadota bacterium]